MKIDITVETPLARTIRVQQLEALFDVPASERARLHFTGDMPFETPDWNVGLICGPSGCGKSTILNKAFGGTETLRWEASSVVDDFDAGLSMEEISSVCQSVGFNTIPAWMRPYRVLSNGEQFRAELARRLLSQRSPIIVDEFTSVVDRQIAKIGAHAVQKYVRAQKKKFIAASCHYDIIDWLQPDWLYEPATGTFTRRSLQRRPPLEVEIRRVDYSYWKIFSAFHYLSADLHRAARCFVLFVEGRPAAFCGVLHFPHAISKKIKRATRLVTLPDWQGLGLAMILGEKVGAAYKALGFRFRKYPAHPVFVRAHLKRTHLWALKVKPATFAHRKGQTSTLTSDWRQGNRPCAVFEYIGPAMDRADAERLLA